MNVGVMVWICVCARLCVNSQLSCQRVRDLNLSLRVHVDP